MHKKIFNILFIILVAISNTSYAETKIGVVKLDVLFKEIPIYNESQTNLKNEFKPKADELKKIETSWNKLNDDYLKNERTMSKNERKAKIKEISDIEKKFRNKQQSLQKELQGKQNSLFYNRIKPFENEKHFNKGKTEMILFSDGNLAENQVDKGNPLPLGYDKWTNNFYANRDLIMNSIHFLAGNKDRLAIRNKSIKFAVLDVKKIKDMIVFFINRIPLLFLIYQLRPVFV